MSKNIVIQEGGVGKQLTADKLKTNLVGGGSCLWVPEDETRLGTKYISENGTFRASDDGLYGYSEVTVSGVGTVTGKDSDGDDAKASVDPETGEIITTKLIDHIAVTTPPTKSEYQDGETINFSGLVVHGYSSTGRDLGAIPLNKLVMQPTVAAYEGEGSSKSATSDLVDGPISFGSTYNYRNRRGPYGTDYVVDTFTITGAEACITALYSGTTGVAIFASSSVRTLHSVRETAWESTGEVINHSESDTTAASPYTYGGKTVYYFAQNIDYNIYTSQISPSPSANVNANNIPQVAWTAVYGTIEEAHSDMTVNVSYSGSDTGGTTLNTNFTVTVTPGTGGATGGGGQAGDTGAGRND